MDKKTLQFLLDILLGYQNATMKFLQGEQPKEITLPPVVLEKVVEGGGDTEEKKPLFGKKGGNMEKIAHFYSKGWKPKEIAEKIGTTKATVYTMISRLKKEGKLGWHFPAEAEKKEGDDGFRVTEEIKEEINEMLLEGKSSMDVAKYYGISPRIANKAIATAKGIVLPI